GNYYVRSSRVSLKSIAADWNEGLSAEAIREDFPSLKLVEVYGAITYYLEHQAEMDAFFKKIDVEYAARRAAEQAANPEWHARMRQRMAEAKQRLESQAKSSAL
ncbi:MAG TPA: DUF433 domain-containing protein, partial [Ktedonobacterales bacterium]